MKTTSGLDSISFKIRLRRNWITLTPPQAMVLSFAAFIALAMMAMHLPLCVREGVNLSFVDTLFMATSAVCVTGLTTANVSQVFTPLGQLVLLLFIQVGSLGVIIFSSSIFLMLGGRLGLRGRRMIQEFLPGLSLSGVVKLTRYILIVIFVSEVVGTILLCFSFVPLLGWEQGLFASVFHSVSAMCGAGFSNFSDSLLTCRDDILVNIVIMTQIVLGGFGFLVLTDLVLYLVDTTRKHRLSLHTHIVLIFSIFLIILGGVGFLFFERSSPEFGFDNVPFVNAALTALFQSVTCRSGGFSTVDVSSLQEETRQLMIFLMFIGGGPGSTAGGIKITTFALLMMATYAQITSRRDIEICGRRVSWDRILQATALTAVAVITVIFVVVLLNYFETIDYSQLLFEAISALGTVGLSTGITSELSNASKLLLCVSMFVGRIGPLTLASSLVTGPNSSRTSLPVGEVIIG